MTVPRPGDVEAALWMLAQLERDTKDTVRRRLALRLDPPASPAAERKDELRLVAEMLRSVEPLPGLAYSYVARSQYDSRRTPASPSSASLVERYGCWRNVCRHAHLLSTEQPNRLRKHRRQASSKAARRYSEREAIDAVQECARELKRTPSTTAYDAWCSAAEQRRRGNVTYPCSRTICRLYRARGGWIAALEDTGLLAPPNGSVRIIARTIPDAIELAAALRASGHLAVHVGHRNWIEFHGTLAEAGLALSGKPTSASAEALWDPRTRARATPPTNRSGEPASAP